MPDSKPEPKTLQNRIISGSFVLLSGSGLTTAINLAYNIVVARSLGPTGFGQTTAVYTLLTLISAITLSYQLVAAKVVAQQAASGAKADTRSLHRSAWAAGAMVATALLLFQHQIASYLNLPTPLLVVFLAVGGAFYVPLGTLRGLIQGVYGFRSLATNLVVEGLVRLGGSILMVRLGYGAAGVIAANAAAMAIAYLALLPKRPVSSPGALSISAVHREIAHALVFFSGQMLINNCDIVLVKHFFAPTSAGLYAVIAMVGRVIFALCQAVVNSMIPVVAGTREEDRKGLSLIATSLGMVLAIGSVLALALRFTPGWVWTRLFGPGFLLSGPHGFPFLLALYAITTVIYSLSAVMITYEMSYKIANMSAVQLVFSGLIIAGICEFHRSLPQVILVQLVLVSTMLLVVAFPFVRSALGQGDQPSGGRVPVRPLRRVTENEVISEFLKSDFGKGEYARYQERARALVFEPNLTSEDESRKRRALFELKHRALWSEIPKDTEWFEVQLVAANLPQVLVFPRAQWRKAARGDFGVEKVAATLTQKNHSQDDLFLAKLASIRKSFVGGKAHLGSVILIGLDPLQQVAIIDGNHRFVAAVQEGNLQQLTFFCGFSPKMTRCCWYRTNLLTLSRYGRNLLGQLRTDSGAELAGLLDSAV
jgi:O-antigen/teichoic acid export membrane protein